MKESISQQTQNRVNKPDYKSGGLVRSTRNYSTKGECNVNDKCAKGGKKSGYNHPKPGGKGK